MDLHLGWEIHVEGSCLRDEVCLNVLRQEVLGDGLQPAEHSRSRDYDSLYFIRIFFSVEIEIPNSFSRLASREDVKRNLKSSLLVPIGMWSNFGHASESFRGK